MLADESAVYWTYGNNYWRAPLGGGGPSDIDNNLTSIWFGSDASTAYYEKWLGPGQPNAIVSRARDGSGAVTVHAEVQETNGAVTIGPGAIFWAERGSIYSAPAGGTGRNLVASLPSSGYILGPIKANDSNVFFRSIDGIFSVPQSGGTPTRLANAAGGDPPALDANSGVAYWNDRCLASSTRGCIDTGGTSYGSVKVDDTAIYFVRGDDLMRLTK